MDTCKECGKEFEYSGSLDQHFSAKHVKKPNAPVYRKKSVSPGLVVVAIGLLIVAGIGIAISLNSGDVEKRVSVDGINLNEVPNGPIHWHPVMTMIIKGERITIPVIGSSGSSHGPGIFHEPIHTHDLTGTLHLEMQKPAPETMILGFFFEKVWKKTFNSTCISDLRKPETGEILCNGPEGNLTMTVNGRPNPQFDKYIPKDLDDVRIVFE